MIKYNIIELNTKICVITENDYWFYKGELMTPSRDYVYYINTQVDKIYEDDLFDNLDTKFDIKRSYFIEEGVKYIKKTKQFKEDEDILPYLISRFGIKNIYLEVNNKAVCLNKSGFIKRYERHIKLNKILNKN